MVSPNTALDQSITWSSSNPAVATVSSTGLVAAISQGTTTIKATSNDGTNVFGSSTIKVAKACQDGDAFEEKNGYVVIEMEDALEMSSEWGILTGIESLGDGYIEYQEPDRFGGAIESGTISYKVKINNPGTYQFKWRSRRAATAASGDAANDTWLKIKGDAFYGVANGTNVDCTDHYMKVWIQRDDWGWNCFGEHGTNGLAIYADFNTAGEYIIEVSGRSKDHIIDRMALFQSGKEALATADATVAATASCDELVMNCEKILASDFDKISGITEYDAANKAAVPNSPADAVNVGLVVLGCGGTNGINQPCAAEETYTGEAGNYFIKVNAMGEPDGECTYEVYVNGTKIGERTNTRIYGTETPAYNIESLQVNTPAIALEPGDVIRVTSNQTSNNLVAEGTGYATARGRWESIEICDMSAPMPVDVTGIVDLAATATVGTAESISLATTVEPSNATNKNIEYSSSNTSVATVNANGEVTGITVGTAIITAKTVEGEYETSCKVTVTKSLKVVLSPIHDAFIENTTTYNDNNLKVENGRRTAYLMFDLSSVKDEIIGASLQLTVGADDGTGTFNINLGNGTSWTETTLTTANAPTKGASLGSLNTTYALGSTYTFDLDASLISGGDKLTLIVSSPSGTYDVWFASKESGNAPQLTLSLKEDDVVIVDPNVDPIIIEAEDFVTTGGTVDDSVFGYDGVTGVGVKIDAGDEFIEWVNNGDYAEYALEFATPASYNITYTIAAPAGSDDAPGEISLYLDDQLISTTTVTSTGGWKQFIELEADGIVNISSSYTIKIVASNDETWQWNLDKITLTPVVNEIPTTINRDEIETVVYPNPFISEINIVSNTELANIAIINTNGSLVKLATVNATTATINVNDLPAGIYILKIQTVDEEYTTQKLSKTRF